MRLSILRVFIFIVTATLANHIVNADEPLRINITEGVDLENFQVGDVDKTAISSFVQSIYPNEINGAQISLPQVIEDQTGIHIRDTSGPGSLSLVSLRGKSADQVMIYLDGMLLNSASGGGVDLSLIPLSDIDTIEVYKDFIPVEFSQSSIGGVINIKTHRQKKNNRAQLIAGFGSFNTQKYAGMLSGGNKFSQFILSAEKLLSDNDFSYTNNNGTEHNTNDDSMVKRQNNYFEQQSLLAKLSFQLHKSQKLFLQTGMFQKKQGLAAIQYREDVDSSLEHENWHTKLKWTSEKKLIPHTSLSWETSLYKKSLIFDDRSNAIGILKNFNKNKNQAYESRVYGSFQKDNFTLLSSVSLALDDYENEDLINPEASKQGKRQRISVGLESRTFFANKKFIINPALQWNHANSESVNTGTTHDSSTFSPKFGVRYQPNIYWDLKANIARYHRLPSLIELYGARGYLQASDELSPESGTNMDIGLSWQHFPKSELFTKLTWDTAIFHTLISNGIAYSFNSQGVGTASNYGKARILGWESQLSLELAYQTQLISNTTIQDPKNTSEEGSSLLIPGRMPFSQRLKIQHQTNKQSFYIEYVREEGMYYDLPNLLPAPAKSLWNIGYMIKFKQLHFSAELKNLSNENYKNYYFQVSPGRSVFATIKYQINT